MYFGNSNAKYPYLYDYQNRKNHGSQSSSVVDLKGAAELPAVSQPFKAWEPPDDKEAHQIGLRSTVQTFNGHTDGLDDNEKHPACPCCTVLHRKLSDEDSLIRRLVLPFVLVLFSFAGGGIFYALERGGRNNYGFWDSLFYANTLFTTIGYGTVAPQTVGGKVFTILYTLPGILLTVVSAKDVGFIMAKYAGRTWRVIRRGMRSNSGPEEKNQKPKPSQEKAAVVLNTQNLVQPTEDDKKKPHNKLLPLPVAFLLLLLWFLISSSYLYAVRYYTPKPWTFFDAFYFFFVSVSTVGLGDLDSMEYYRSRTCADFVFIIIGITLFTMCMNIVEDQVDNISEKVVQTIMEEYQKALEEGRVLGMPSGGEPAHLTDNPALAKKRADHAARLFIRNLIKKKGGWLRLFVGHGFEDRMVAEYKRRAKMRSAETQTVTETRDVEIAVQPEGDDKETMTGDFYVAQWRAVQSAYGDREQEAVDRHLRRIHRGYTEALQERKPKGLPPRQRSRESPY